MGDYFGFSLKFRRKKKPSVIKGKVEENFTTTLQTG